MLRTLWYSQNCRVKICNFRFHYSHSKSVFFLAISLSLHKIAASIFLFHINSFNQLSKPCGYVPSCSDQVFQGNTQIEVIRCITVDTVRSWPRLARYSFILIASYSWGIKDARLAKARTIDRLVLDSPKPVPPYFVKQGHYALFNHPKRCFSIEKHQNRLHTLIQLLYFSKIQQLVTFLKIKQLIPLNWVQKRNNAISTIGQTYTTFDSFSGGFPTHCAFVCFISQLVADLGL